MREKLSSYSTLLGRYLFELKIASLSRWAASVALLALAYAHQLRGNAVKSARYLTQAHRITPSPAIRQFIERQIRPWLAREGQGNFFFQHHAHFSSLPADDIEYFLTRRVMVLKNPRFEDAKLVEKGVLYAMFTSAPRVLMERYDLQQLLEQYFLVLEPSWAGYCDPAILALANLCDAPIFVCATEKEDYAFLSRIESNLVPLTYGASNWVNPDCFKPLPLAKQYDAIMVSVWSQYKRHQVLLKAMAKLGGSDFKIALVGAPLPESRTVIEQLVAHYGLTQNVDIFERLPQPEVNVLLNQSKVNVLLSKKEGSNRAVFEGFFADVPAIVLKDNIGVNKDYINEHTGLLIDDKDLYAAIMRCRQDYAKFSPRAWALAHISPAKTTALLNEEIKNYSLAQGLPWTEDIACHSNSPELVYTQAGDCDRYRSPLNLLG